MKEEVHNFEIKKVKKETEYHFEYLVYLNGEFLVSADMEKGLISTSPDCEKRLDQFLKVKASEFPDGFLMVSYCSDADYYKLYKEFDWCGIKKEKGELSLLITTFDGDFEDSLFNYFKFSVAFADIIQKSKKTKLGSKNYFSLRDLPFDAEYDALSIYYNCPYTETTTIEDVYKAALKELPIIYKQAVLNLVKEFTKD